MISFRDLILLSAILTGTLAAYTIIRSLDFRFFLDRGFCQWVLLLLAGFWILTQRSAS